MDQPLPEYVPEPDDEGDQHIFEIERDLWDQDNRAENAQEIGSEKILPPHWLFEDFLFSQSLTLLSAEPFTGKTMFLLAMMASLDTFEPLCGQFLPLREGLQRDKIYAPNPHVLFIGQDAPTWDYKGQYQKLLRGLIGDADPPSTQIGRASCRERV